MQSFLEQTLPIICNKYKDLSQCVFILPSNRAVKQSKRILGRIVNKPIFSPEFFTIEQFVEHIAQLEPIDELEAYVSLYKLYLEENQDNPDSIGQFLNWATQLLGDFNEIDRYLLDAEKVFEYLTALVKLKEWTKGNEPTTLVSNYVSFSKTLFPLYHKYNKALLKQHKGYSGLLSRTAANRTTDYLEHNLEKNYLFIGLNALNKAEIEIITSILGQTNSSVFWDIDPILLEDTIHDASLFLRQYVKLWSKYQSKLHISPVDELYQEKAINIIGTSGNHSQISIVNTILQDLNYQTESTVIVLADESLLPLFLSKNSIPLEDINITMGYPVIKTSIGSLVFGLLEFCESAKNNSWSLHEVLTLLNLPLFTLFVDAKIIEKFKARLLKNNPSSITGDYIILHLDIEKSSFSNLLRPIQEGSSILTAIKTLLESGLHHTHY